MDLALIAIVCGILHFLVLLQLPDMLKICLVILPFILMLRNYRFACQFIVWGSLEFLWEVFNAGNLLGQAERLSRSPEVTAVVQVIGVTLLPMAGVVE
ncbi:MAG: hypothetical protein G5663_06520 [Serratia symbiotica]|nr:hypothetical protein [Serratia symbiotica]